MRIIKKILTYAIVVAGVVIVLDVALVVGFSVYRPPIRKADAIIVLGAAINTPALYNRSLQALRLYEDGKADMVVVSGGKDFDNSISEAAYMEGVIEKNQRAATPVILEDNSHTTYENLKFSRAEIPDAESVIVVSDRFHLARGVLMAYREGFAHVQWSAPKPIYYRGQEMAFYYFREMVAMISYIPKFISG